MIARLNGSWISIRLPMVEPNQLPVVLFLQHEGWRTKVSALLGGNVHHGGPRSVEWWLP